MRHARILIVEDDRLAASRLQETLESLDHEVIGIVPSGEVAIRKAGESRPDLLLMDVLLEGNIDGIAAAEQIAEKYAVPVVYLTAYSDQKTLQRASVAKAYGYVVKPFTKDQLQIAIEMALHKYKFESNSIHGKSIQDLVLKHMDCGLICARDLYWDPNDREELKRTMIWS